MSDPNSGVRHAAGDALVQLQAHWARATDKPLAMVGAFAVAPSDSDLVYIAELNQLAASRDGGVTWTTLTNSLSSHISALAINASEPNVIYAGADSLGLYKSTDGAATWHAVNNGLGMAPGVRLRITVLVPFQRSNR